MWRAPPRRCAAARVGLGSALDGAVGGWGGGSSALRGKGQAGLPGVARSSRPNLRDGPVRPQIAGCCASSASPRAWTTSATPATRASVSAPSRCARATAGHSGPRATPAAPSASSACTACAAAWATRRTAGGRQVVACSCAGNPSERADGPASWARLHSRCAATRVAKHPCGRKTGRGSCCCHGCW